MSGGPPIGREIANGLYIGNYTNATGVPIAYDFFGTSTNANTKTGWNQLSGGISSDVVQLFIETKLFESATASAQVAIDIGVGASGFEQPLISNLVTSVPANTGQLMHLQVPVTIQAGARVTMRYATSQASSVQGFPLGISIKGYDGAFQTEGYGAVEAVNGTFGASTPYSTSFTPGLKTEGSWTQLVGSTTRNYDGFLVGLDQQGNYDSTNGPQIITDIGIGPSGSEQPMALSIFWDTFQSKIWGPFFFPIPMGSRISVRGATDTAANTGGSGCVVYGIYG